MVCRASIRNVIDDVFQIRISSRFLSLTSYVFAFPLFFSYLGEMDFLSILSHFLPRRLSRSHLWQARKTNDCKEGEQIRWIKKREKWRESGRPHTHKERWTSNNKVTHFRFPSSSVVQSLSGNSRFSKKIGRQELEVTRNEGGRSLACHSLSPSLFTRFDLSLPLCFITSYPLFLRHRKCRVRWSFLFPLPFVCS